MNAATSKVSDAEALQFHVLHLLVARSESTLKLEELCMGLAEVYGVQASGMGDDVLAAIEVLVEQDLAYGSEDQWLATRAAVEADRIFGRL